MDLTRRKLGLLAALAINSKANDAPLPSMAKPFDELKKTSGKGHDSWAVLDGMTHAGCPLEVHITNLAPGEMPHPPHHHEHEEMFLIEQGTVEVTINGKATRLGANSAAYVHSGEEHGIKNVGEDHAQYFVVAIGKK